MRLNYLREFQCVASMLNFTKAAKVLNISQSSLSKHIIELENNTGLRLFDHNAAKPKLTPIGNEYLKEISLILSAYDAGLEKCLAMQEAGLQTLTFQEATLSAAMKILYRYIQKYTVNRPQIDICFSDMRNCDSVIEGIEKNIVDIALDMRCNQDKQDLYINTMEKKGYRLFPLYEGPLLVWFRKDNRLSKLDSIGFDDIKHLPIMTSTGKVFDSVRPAVHDLFIEENAVPHFKMVHMATLTSLSAYFLSDFGDSVLITTESMVEDERLNSREDITYRKGNDAKLYTVIYLIADRENGLANEFIDFAKAIVT